MTIRRRRCWTVWLRSSWTTGGIATASIRRGAEVGLADHGVVGRYLAGVLDAPIGANDAETSRELPRWLTEVPVEIRRRWARTSVTVRGCRREDRTGGVQIVERRHDGYRNALRDFLADLVERLEWITLAGDRTVYVRPPAADRLHARLRLSVGQPAAASD